MLTNDANERALQERLRGGDEAAFDRAWQEGRAMLLDHAMEYALEVAAGAGDTPGKNRCSGSAPRR